MFLSSKCKSLISKGIVIAIIKQNVNINCPQKDAEIVCLASKKGSNTVVTAQVIAIKNIFTKGISLNALLLENRETAYNPEIKVNGKKKKKSFKLNSMKNKKILIIEEIATNAVRVLMLLYIHKCLLLKLFF